MRSNSDRLPGEFKACKKEQTMSTKNHERTFPARGNAFVILYRTWFLSPIKNGKIEKKNVL